MISIESYHITVRRVIDKEDHGFNYREWWDLNEKIVVEKNDSKRELREEWYSLQIQEIIVDQ